MTVLCSIIKLTGYAVCRERGFECFVTCMIPEPNSRKFSKCLRQILQGQKIICSFNIIKSNWNVERYFGSKLDIPSPPKRPLSAYMIFCKENRKDLLKENPSLSNPEQIKILAKKWSLLTEEMKKPYEVSARENTQMYGIEHKKFYENLTEEQKEELSRLKAKKIESRRLYRQKKVLRESGLPKAPTTAYALFVQAEAKKKPAVKSGAINWRVLQSHIFSVFSKRTLKESKQSEFIKKVAELWNTLPEESKKVYEKQAELEKTRYVHEMKEWRTKMLLEGNKKILKAYEELKVKGKSSLDIHEEQQPSAEKKKSVKKSTKAEPKN